jgi:hypothetical protein
MSTISAFQKVAEIAVVLCLFVLLGLLLSFQGAIKKFLVAYLFAQMQN